MPPSSLYNVGIRWEAQELPTVKRVSERGNLCATVSASPLTVRSATLRSSVGNPLPAHRAACTAGLGGMVGIPRVVWEGIYQRGTTLPTHPGIYTRDYLPTGHIYQGVPLLPIYLGCTSPAHIPQGVPQGCCSKGVPQGCCSKGVPQGILLRVYLRVSPLRCTSGYPSKVYLSRCTYPREAIHHCYALLGGIYTTVMHHWEAYTPVYTP